MSPPPASARAPCFRSGAERAFFGASVFPGVVRVVWLSARPPGRSGGCWRCAGWCQIRRCAGTAPPSRTRRRSSSPASGSWFAMPLGPLGPHARSVDRSLVLTHTLLSHTSLALLARALSLSLSLSLSLTHTHTHTHILSLSVHSPGAHFFSLSLPPNLRRPQVLDEADRMLDLGFAADLDALLGLLPRGAAAATAGPRAFALLNRPRPPPVHPRPCAPSPCASSQSAPSLLPQLPHELCPPASPPS
eukprot:SAG11_NODE_3352_length_2507_cov_1.368771_2_plen_247_part_00